MKHLVLDFENVILCISDTIGYQENGNVLVNRGTLAYAAILVSRVVEVASIPANVAAMRYCYTNGQFVLNPHYVDPTPPTDGAVSEAFSILHGDTEVK
ncbi:MAG: hypothetical protein RR893_12820 [Clostridia bacterium]